MKTTAALMLAGLAGATAQKLGQPIGSTDDEWALFKKEHAKEYKDAAEHDYRLSVFTDNLEWARQYNQKVTSHWVGVTKFADLTPEEFKAQYLGAQVPEKTTSTDYDTWEYKNVKAGDTVDWRQKGAVTPVKDQGQCGSCWAFSTTGSTEGANFIANGNLVSLSEQELVDCAGSTGNMGCNGGLMDNAFKWIIQNGGITTESNYAYTARDGQCDKQKEADHAVSLSTFTDVPVNNEKALKQAVSSQPVSIAIEADQMVFQMYKGGILDDASCGTNLDHGVLIVGYCEGQDCPDASSLSDGDGFWIVKNSWGATWGEQGYIRLAMNVSNPAGQCGLAKAASYPTAGAPGPSSGPSSSPSPSPSNSPSPSGGSCPQGTCPDGTTCCPLNADHSQWGCCPMPSAVCCSDYMHCCPNGTTCDVSDNTCNRGNVKVGKAGAATLYSALGL